jgi:hypothetical protein
VNEQSGATDDLDRPAAGPEVGDEGGTPGDVEVVKDVVGTGSEAGETWRPAETQTHQIVRDDEGEGRRTP